jgi:hypothetical protein
LDLKLRTGVKVSVHEEETSKFLVFDTPVRAIELTTVESIKLGSSLMKGGRTGVTAELRNLIESGFFSKPKSLSNIKTKLFHEGIETRASSLNVLLSKMVERGELNKEGRKGSYLYIKP